MQADQSHSRKSRTWCFTINNYTDEQYEAALNWDKAIYAIVGKEIAASGTPHLQGYWRFQNAIRMSTIKAAFPTAHLEISRGSAEQNITYCSKEGNFEERGERPSTTGHLAGMLFLISSIDDILMDLSDIVLLDTDERYGIVLEHVYTLAMSITDLHLEFSGEDHPDFPPIIDYDSMEVEI